MSDSLNALVETFYQAFSGETDLVDVAVAPDWEDIPLAPGQGPGAEGLKQMIGVVSKSFSNLTIVVQDVIDGRGPDGNGRIGVRGELRATHIGEIFGVAATGKDVIVAIHDFHDVRNGRFVRTWHVEDWLGFFAQVGRMPESDGAAQ